MAIFKCKMCGGTLEIQNNETVAVCQYCGTKQTLPKLDDDRKANLYDRANHFRRNNEFDKAMGIYEQILDEDNTDAEAYWSLVLCRYGIEYIEDPSSHKRIPTVNRAQFTSIFDDDNYKSALQYADDYQKDIYEQEASVINDIQKGILAISSQEEPFDVFICYKESDNNGRRTPDSVLATELYHELTREGYKVFFSRITLEEKLGSAYEPYIFAALNSAKVMVVLGTKPEFFNAVWVKNEWSRYLALIKNGARKMLIPAYKDMDPYDLPEEFSHLQAQDMSKLGFMQDLIRGIKKLVPVSTHAEIVNKVAEGKNLNSNNAVNIKRTFIALEDKEWKKAKKLCEQILATDPECAEAYLIKLMADLKVVRKEQLEKHRKPLHKNKNYAKAVRFGQKELEAISKKNLEFLQELKRKKKKRCLIIIPSIAGLLALTFFCLSINPNYFNNITEISAKTVYTVGLKKDGTVVMTGEHDLYDGQCNVDDWTDILSVSTGDNHTAGVKKDGTVLAVGLNDEGQCNVDEWTDIVSVSAGNFHTVGLKKDGTVVAVGLNEYGECDIDDWTDIVSVFATLRNTVGLKKDGTVVATGIDYNEQSSVKNWTDIVSVSVGDSHTVGLKEDGTVVAAGRNHNGECNVSDWTDIVSVSIGKYHTVGLKKDGTVVAVGEKEDDQCNVDEWTDIVSVSAGDYHTVGLKKDGTVVAVGSKEYGECDVDEWTDIVSVSAGLWHTVGLKEDGTAVATGYNSYGECDVKMFRNPCMVILRFLDALESYL